ncbi:FadR/GntR family transcriptional regulator [Allostreptomyces psammosilenae]|uniref:DNA-binding FadR family transcriptional regulator n=1 Tax=Allostreptomyces psammosilenae TaxID=1892865 RepID=A0A852ZZ64_9ACTN|nr:FadR/GntR family transcriptional regulator [Allostreptomyces psammosilenae]NYI03408.1 DNA-binding FadR family transcriptional regulator [Allostreptomyces psammosilenae]
MADLGGPAPRPDDTAARAPRRKRAFEEVLGTIEARIVAGELSIGDRLPGERQLATDLGVSRSSVREAMRVLEALGVLSAQTGSGPDAGATLVGSSSAALADVLRMHVELASFRMTEVVESRMMIERWTVETAARHAGEAEWARIAEPLEAMRDPGLPLGDFVRLDTAFHVAIAQACGNRLVSAFMRALRDAVHRHAVDAVARLGQWPTVAARLREDHERIYAAIREGAPERGVAALEAHLRHTYPEVTRIRAGLPDHTGSTTGDASGDHRRTGP